ncbi:bacteriohemerythrin [Luxibacter massiliensis]|uniref:bacteriohemerythrin n=1 Tax=Luxibacter massiliensis TaxID=2219695 RepID=UPI000F0525C0|nr:bacteriohemerythrin [Luxibacter massiliensis]
MMWKENYRLGIDRIDNQHIELFDRTENLIKDITQNAPIEVYREALGFLKDYVIYHFRDEEEYQASIHYEGLEEHKKEHLNFTKTVLEYEDKLEKNNFDVHTLKDLAGVITAWLIYHVADTDQKIVAGRPQYTGGSFDSNMKLFSSSAIDVINTMAGIDLGTARQEVVAGRPIQGDVFIELPFIGALNGKAIFGFSKELALSLVSTMTMMEYHELDELVLSALCELTNISCGNVAGRLAGQGILCDIKPPVIKEKKDYIQNPVTGIYIDTGVGGLEVVAMLNETSPIK